MIGFGSRAAVTSRSEIVMQLVYDCALEQEGLLRVQRGNGLHIFVRSGSVWITQEGDTRDVVLEAGESFRLDRDGLALINAFSPAHVTVSGPVRVSAGRWFRGRGAHVVAAIDPIGA
jgi:Protein of unknown function (DUF2917)